MLVHRIRRFKRPVPEKSHRDVQKTKRNSPTNLHMALSKTRIYWLFRLSLISETPICKWLPLSLQQSLQSADVPQKKSKPTALNYKRESEIQSNHSFRLKIGIGELIVWYFGTDTLQLIVRMKVSARYFGTDSFLSLFTFGAMHPFQHANTVQYGQPQPQRQTYIHSATGPHVQMQPQGDLVDRKPSWHVGFV